MVVKEDTEVRRAKAEYMRQWREKNRERVREYDRQYWQRRVEREKAKKAGEVNG